MQKKNEPHQSTSCMVRALCMMAVSLLLGFLQKAAYSDTGFQSLRMGADARTGAMGMADASTANRSASAFSNPAGLLWSAGNDAMFSWHRYIQGIKSGAFGLSTSGKRTAFGIHILYTDVGGLEHRIVPSPEPIGTFSWNEFVIGLSCARQWRFWVFGMTVKLLYEKIYVEDAWGAAVDFGAVYQFRRNGLRFGAAIFNIGQMDKLRVESTKLPLTAKLGAAMPMTAGGIDWTVALDGVLEKDEPFHCHAGLECGLYKKLYLRTGYQTGYDNRGSTFGMGLAWNRYRFDYSYMPLKSGLGDSHRLTFGIGW